MNSRYIAMTFSHENHSELRRFWEAYRKKNPTLSGFGTTRADDEKWGGKMQILDWHNKTIVQSRDLLLATGMTQVGGCLYVCSYREIYCLDESLTTMRKITHPLFSNLHSTCQKRDGLMVCSSGIDSILNLGLDDSVSMFWYAVEHGYDKSPTGESRKLDLSSDHRNMYYPTISQTTHVNSCLWEENEDVVFATLFHQGAVVSIDNDGKTKLLFDGMRAPHSIGRRGDGLFYCVDSGRNRIMLWTNKNKVSVLPIKAQCAWIQDVHWDSLLGGFLVADANNHRLLLIEESGTVKDEYKFNEEWKIYGVLPL